MAEALCYIVLRSDVKSSYYYFSVWVNLYIYYMNCGWINVCRMHFFIFLNFYLLHILLTWIKLFMSAEMVGHNIVFIFSLKAE